MVKEENTTIDGFPVRSAKDSKLVTRSRAEKIPANKKKVSTTKKSVVTKRKTATASKRVAKKVPSKISRQTKRSTSTVSREIKTEPKKVSVSKTDVMIEEEIFGATKKAHEDFLAPVESFGLDEIESDSGTSEGRVEEVEDSEVPEIKKTEKRAKEKKEKTKGKKHVVVRVILIVILLLLVGGGVAFYFWGDSILKKLTGGEGNIWSAIGAMTSETYEPLKEDSNGRTNVLVFGTSGYDMTGTNGEETHDGAQLTDSVMLMSLDQKTGDIAMVSLPRDLKVGYTCTATGKINEIYWCANMDDTNEAAGAEALEKEVEEILGVDIQYYIHLNWGSLVNIVDTLGGVTVTLDEDIDDYGWTNAKFEAGVPYTINGEQALGLARARHGTEHGDFTRGNSQQKLIIAIKDRLLEKGLGLTEILGIVNALGDNARTNFSLSEIKTGLHLLEEFDLDSVRQIPLVSDEAYYMTTAMINGISYVVPSAGVGVYTQIQDLVKTMLNSNPAAREGAQIEILNGSGEPGVAAQEQAKLEEEGYKINDIGDAPIGTYDYSEKIEIYDTSEGKKPETKEALEEYYSVIMKPESELPNGISGYGYDFIIIVGKE